MILTTPPQKGQIMKNISVDNIEKYTETFSTLIQNTTYGDIEKAALWYADAEKVAHEVARNLDTTLEVGASIISAFSPRERWTSNVSKAIAFSLGEKVVGLSNNLKMAETSIHLGFDALRGPKTNAFARAIAGDPEAVVIDVWMMRAANMEVDSPNKTQYTELSQAIKRVAKMNEMTPRTVQALIWIIVRGSAS
jgi:hypothetical protein